MGAITLEGPAGAPSGGGGDVECVDTADCGTGEICSNGTCVTDDDGVGVTDITQITFDTGHELDPQWDPASETIAFQTDRSPAGTSVRNIGSVQADGSGEGNMAVGPNSGFGVGGPMSWVGTTGLLMVNERVVFHEYMTFDTSQAPFTRTATDGDDEAFTRELLITGGGGGDFMTASRDGSTVLWRFSTSGGAGTAGLRVGPFSSLTGQDADATGTLLFSDFDATAATLMNGAALTPDGSQVVISLPSGDGSDLFLYSASDPPALLGQLTFTGASMGENNRSPDISPDGTRVAFSSTPVGDDTDLYLVGLDGTGLTQLTSTDRSEAEPSWSPGGDRIAFQRADDDGWNIYVLTLGGISPGPGCDSNGDCASDETCVGGACVPVTGCADTCLFADDGECDDGGSGSVTDLCDAGTDCRDCGPRDDTTEPDCSADGVCNASCTGVDTDPDCGGIEDCSADGVCNPSCTGVDTDPDCGGIEDCSADGVCNPSCTGADIDPDCVGNEDCSADGFCNENCSDLDADPDCDTAPVDELKCTTSSDFTGGDEGWLILGDAQGGRGEPDFVASGGNAGGHVSADDDVQGGVWFFQAPASYHGNYSGALGNTFTFDLKQSSLNSQFDAIDVSMMGGGLTIVADAGSNPGTDWTAYSIVLGTSAGWTLDALAGTAATEADILTVLTDLSDILIRGEYVSGADTGGLDNVVLNSNCAGQ
jgi:hypothetical protein